MSPVAFLLLACVVMHATHFVPARTGEQLIAVSDSFQKHVWI